MTRAERIEKAARALVESALAQPMAHVSEWEPIRALRAALAPESGGREPGDVAVYHHGMGQICGLTTAAEMAERWSDQPVARIIARDLRRLIDECSPSPSSPSSAQGEGEFKARFEALCRGVEFVAAGGQPLTPDTLRRLVEGARRPLSAPSRDGRGKG